MKIIITIIFLLFHDYTLAQTIKRDTILYNQFRDYVEWSKQNQKIILEELENPEKYQMVYFDKAIIDKKNHKIFVYSSYDLYWADESGLTWIITMPRFKKLESKRKKLLH